VELVKAKKMPRKEKVEAKKNAEEEGGGRRRWRHVPRCPA
jgi:hypothetical protein